MTSLNRALLDEVPPPSPLSDVLEGGRLLRAEADTTTGEPVGPKAGVYLHLLQDPTYLGLSGRWTIVSGTRAEFVDTVLVASSWFGELYEMVRANASTVVSGVGGLSWVVAERMLHDFIVNEYDRTDPVEAAEQMLVGLGSCPRFLPRTLASR